MSNELPESDKLAKGARDRTAIIDFLDWCGARGIFLGEHTKPGHWWEVFVPISRLADDLALDYLGVDPKKLEEERRAMLAHVAGEAL